MVRCHTLGGDGGKSMEWEERVQEQGAGCESLVQMQVRVAREGCSCVSCQVARCYRQVWDSVHVAAKTVFIFCCLSVSVTMGRELACLGGPGQPRGCSDGGKEMSS